LRQAPGRAATRRTQHQRASEKVRLDASKYLDGAHERDRQGVTVNVGVAVRAGYIIDVSKHRDRATEILRQSGPKRNALEAGYSIIEGETSK
jgi:hypothetical protein